ncbi:MAG: hypothetical protein ACKO02_02785 [Cyanobium sp.]
MSKTFRPWQPGQASLLPPSPSDWLTADHQVYFLLDLLHLVDVLDLSAIVIPAQAKDPRGERGFDPRTVSPARNRFDRHSNRLKRDDVSDPATPSDEASRATNGARAKASPSTNRMTTFESR